MDRELAVVFGMSISYVASLAGMFIAMWAYRRHQKRKEFNRGSSSLEPDRSVNGSVKEK